LLGCLEGARLLAINEEQAAVIQLIFEMFASRNYGLVTLKSAAS
jgi:hypothetical protein